jgi:Family of unknown function (DUF6920)
MNPSTLIFTDIAFPAVALIALAVVGALVFGAVHWRRSTDTLRGHLRDAAADSPGPPFDDASLGGLPPPVARYLRYALRPGQPRVTHARIASRGEFRRGEAADAWIPFKADQDFTGVRPGFVWDARMRMAPGIAIRVVDAYVGGAGTMRAAVAGLVTVMDAPQSETLARGELMRWLAETPWLPTALLPGGRVAWSSLDETSARATVVDGTTRVSADFHFGREGEVLEVFVPDRPREVDGGYVPTPWSGRFCSYHEMDGMRIPREALVQWHLPGGEQPYWRGRITDARYETALAGGPAR